MPTFIKAMETSIRYMLFVTYFLTFVYRCISFRRQLNEYSPRVVKYPRLDSSYHPLIDSSFIPVPPPRLPDHVVAGSSRTDYEHSFSSSHLYPHPPAPAFLESPNSLQTYAKDKVDYVQMVLNCGWCTRVLTNGLCKYRLEVGLVRVCVFVASAEWSDGGAVWGLPAAISWFGTERDVPSSTAAGHTACLFRFVWNPAALCSSCLVWFLFCVCFLQWHDSTWLDLLWMVWAAGAATQICVWFWRETWGFLTLHPECHPKRVFVQSLMAMSCFSFRKDKILSLYCLASKSCSNHCVSSKNPFRYWAQ